MSMRFSTDDAPGHRRLALWQDIVCDVYVQLDCKSDLGLDFRGAVSRASLGPASCSEVSSGRQHVLRTPSRIARASEDFILVALGKHGAGGITQDGRDVLVRPGEFALYDTTRPYELHFDAPFTQTIFQIPRALLQRRLGNFEMLTATLFSSARPMERLAHDFIAAAVDAADSVDADTGARLADQALDLIAMALGERVGNHPLPTTTHRSAMLFRLKSHIAARLSDPQLSLASTAAALGVSPRYVNNLLAYEDTSFQRHVLAQRLVRCERDLTAAHHAHRQISEIAFDWGFNDLTHFGRAFRERYGQSPRDWRRAQAERLPLSGPPKPR